MGKDLGDRVREEFNDYWKDRLALEQRIATLEAFMNRHDSGGTTKMKSAERVAGIKSRSEFWKAIIVQILITGGLILAAYLALPKRD